MINTIILGHALNVLPKLPAESVSCVTTSPPYWSLRDYGIEPVIWDGDKNCKHEWGNKSITLKHKAGETNPGKESWFKDKGASDDKGNCFCLKCSAWRGSLGLEPTFELYIKHLCDIFDEVKRVLRKDGTCFINIGDSYWGGGQGGADYGGKEIVPSSNFGHVAKGKNYLNKSLCDIPYRFSIEMINRGWIKRNTIIWDKPNCMPASADDRFTVDFEYLFFFTKNNKAIFWTNEKTLECVDKKPLGTKGIEGKDWEWRECTNCHGEGEVIGKALKEGATPIIIGNGIVTKNTKAFRTCPRCKGSGKIKYSFWTGHDYWFEQQFEKYTGPLDRWGGDNLKATNKSDWDEGTGQTTYRDRNMRPNDQGRNKRCVWIIPTQPFPEAHFAVYPDGLIEIPIKAGCPEFICKKCGKARVKIYETIFHKRPTNDKPDNYKSIKAEKEGNKDQMIVARKGIGFNEHKEIGYTDCGCNASWESGIVLDPFIGSGTTAREALKQRKRFIGIEIKQEYIDMSHRKIAKVQQKIF